MASLSSGVFVKLLEDMGTDEKNLEDHKPVLLQIRSIIPVLTEGNLWPNQGFFLKVSDLSHAAYVSLPQEQNEMILSNQLQLGQFIYVEKLESAHPVPVLRGLKPLPGRHPCIGTPADLVATTKATKFWGSSDSGLVSEKRNGAKKKAQGRPHSSSASRAYSNRQQNNETTLNGMRRIGNDDKRTSILKGSQLSYDKDCDSDSSKSSLSSISAVNIQGPIGMKIGKENSDPPAIKSQPQPLNRTRSAPVSPARSARCDSSDDNSSSTMRRKHSSLGMKSDKSSNKSRMPASRKNLEETLNPAVVFNSASDKRWTETKILWDSLPSNLVKLGKEVLRHKDVAFQAAVEALQEASTAERLIKCLSAYSQLHTSKGNIPEPSVDEFFDFQDDLDHTRLIVQSLTNINLPRSSGTDANNTCSVKEVLKLAFERKKNATSWIKEAVAFDLSPFSAPAMHAISSSVEANNAVKKPTTLSHNTKPRGSCIVSKQRKNSEVHIGLAAEMDETPNWIKGIAMSAAADLAGSLQHECRRWFLAHFENYLDGVESKTVPMDSDSQIAGMMCQIKKVNDWLEVIAGREASFSENGFKDILILEDSEAEACRRVKNKIYGVLLGHVERTAIALENMNVTAQV